MMSAMDSFTQQAMNLLTSSRIADALDLSKEDLRIVARYGTGDTVKRIDENGADSRPVTFSEVFATLYHHLGIDVSTATVSDHNGRADYLVEGGAKPVRELVGV